jgi:hypothetical protein
MNAPETNEELDSALALAALGWLLGDNARASRLLAVTGLTPEDLRARLDDPALLGAILAFLEAHEPDLLACAEAIGRPPAALVNARERLMP